MKEFTELLTTTETLLGPNGCPWDRIQTMKDTRSCIIEEAAELVDAIDLEDNHHIQEELGDLFFVVLFLCNLAEKENRCTLANVLHDLNAKLIRRHPHVFGDAKIDNVEQMLAQWNEIKKKEKGKTQRTSALDSIPKGLPALARAEKVSKKIENSKFTKIMQPAKPLPLPAFETEEELGQLLFAITAQARRQGLEAEHALRKILIEMETSFRKFELETKEIL